MARSHKGYAQAAIADIALEIWKYKQSDSEAHAKVLQNLVMPSCETWSIWPHT